MSKKIFTVLKQTNQRYTLFDKDTSSYTSGLTEKEMVNFAMNYLPFSSLDELYKDFDKYFKVYQTESTVDSIIKQLLLTHKDHDHIELSKMALDISLMKSDKTFFFKHPQVYVYPFKDNDSEKGWVMFNELKGEFISDHLSEDEILAKFKDLYSDDYSEKYIMDYFQDLKDNLELNKLMVSYRIKETKDIVYNI